MQDCASSCGLQRESKCAKHSGSETCLPVCDYRFAWYKVNIVLLLNIASIALKLHRGWKGFSTNDNCAVWEVVMIGWE